MPDCPRLTLDGLITNLKSFNSRNYPGIKHLKLGRLFNISERWIQRKMCRTRHLLVVISNVLVWAFQCLSFIEVDDGIVHMVMEMRKMILDYERLYKICYLFRYDCIVVV